MDEMQKVSAETLDLMKDNLGKAVTTGTGLVGYNLEAPSKHLIPFLSPLRNRIPRKVSKTGTSCNWKQINGITMAGRLSTTEGNRGGMIEYSVEDKLAAFKSFGLQDSVTLEAIAAGRNFEDVKAMSTTNLLLKVMTEEEKLILGGNRTSLGVVAQPVLTPIAAGGSMAANAAYSVKVAALTLTGANNCVLNSQENGLTVGLVDGITAVSAAQTAAVLANGRMTVSVTPIRGAFAYAIFGGVGGAETLQMVSTTSICTLNKDVINGTGFAAVGADKSADTNAFDGIIPQVIAGGGYFLDNLGAKISKGNGGIAEIDAINSYMFNRLKVGISRWYVSEQLSRDITDAIIAGAGAPMLMMNNTEKSNVTGNYMVTEYVNKSYGGQRQILEVHPWLPQGTMLGVTESIPFPNANIPSVFEMEMGYDYTQIEYAQTLPKYEYEVRAYGALKSYFPVGCAFIQNVGAGIQ